MNNPYQVVTVLNREAFFIMWLMPNFTTMSVIIKSVTLVTSAKINLYSQLCKRKSVYLDYLTENRLKNTENMLYNIVFQYSYTTKQ